MSDTSFILPGGKTVTLSKGVKAGLIYVGLDVVLSALLGLGQTLHELQRSDWDTMWAAQRAGWIMLQTGGILSSALLTLKAYVSASSSKADTQPQPQPNVNPSI